ncbi:MAG: FAD-dependent oxidoreductase [Paenibacillaceae bacterium]|nr:FAD-dependent oxidoreductase [Paenibacillaceae bacterium]
MTGTLAVYRESARDIPLLAEMDVVVIGGGPSGVAAAVTAAEQGMKTLIVERYGFFGGMTVAGLSGTICGLFSSSLKHPLERIVDGFAGRFVDMLKRKGGIAEPFPFGHTALCVHDPLVWKEAADALIRNAGVHVLFHTLFVEPIMDGDRIVGIIVENKDGRSAIKGNVFVDASGDGDVAARSGAPVMFGKDGFVQFPTMIFRMGQVDWALAARVSPAEVEAMIDEEVQAGRYELPRRHIYLLPMPHGREALVNATRIARPGNGAINGTNAADLTWSEFEGRRQIREYARFLQQRVPGFAEAYVIDSAVQIGIRQTRTILGEYVLANDDIMNARKFERAVARSAWPIEAHGKDVKIVYVDDDYYEIPFDVMLPQKVEQLITAGRCISAEHEALASARVTAQCFEEGMAAGYAAYAAVTERVSPKRVDVGSIRAFMIARGANL